MKTFYKNTECYKTLSYIEIKINFFQNFPIHSFSTQQHIQQTATVNVRILCDFQVMNWKDYSMICILGRKMNVALRTNHIRGYSGSHIISKGLECITRYLKTSLTSINCYLAVREGCKIMVFIIKGIKSATTLWTFCLYNCTKTTKYQHQYKTQLKERMENKIIFKRLE